MTRLAGTKGSYQFAVIDRTTGQPSGATFELPSVTTIIKRVLARPALERWMYRQGIESVEHLLEHVDREDGRMCYEMWQDLIDSDLDALLGENGLRPLDIRDEAAARGDNAHKVAEALAAGCFGGVNEEGWFYDCCPGIAGPWDGYCDGALRWHEETNPAVIAPEVPLWSLTHRYAGTADLLWYADRRATIRTITDFKTHEPLEDKRGLEGPAYLTDRIQNQAYAIAAEEMWPGARVNHTSVVIFCRDGTYVEDHEQAPPGSFLLIRELYRLLEGT